MTQFLRHFHFFLKTPSAYMGLGHKLPIGKQATILPTYLFLKPAQLGLSQMSCFIVFFSVGLTFINSFHVGGLFQRASACSQGACTHARLYVRTPGSYPSEGNSTLVHYLWGDGVLGYICLAQSIVGSTLKCSRKRAFGAV